VSSRALVLVVAAALMTAAWLYRYDTHAVDHAPAGVYIIDRWNGDVRFAQGRDVYEGRRKP